MLRPATRGDLQDCCRELLFGARMECCRRSVRRKDAAQRYTDGPIKKETALVKQSLFDKWYKLFLMLLTFCKFPPDNIERTACFKPLDLLLIVGVIYNDCFRAAVIMIEAYGKGLAG